MFRLLMERLFILFYILFLQIFSVNVNAQTNANRINIQSNNYSFSEIVSQVEKQSGFLITYDAQLIDPNKKYKFNIANSSLESCLQAWLEPLGMQYKLVGRQIILTKKIKKTAVINGLIRDAKSGESIKGLVFNIIINEKLFEVTTNNYGHFNCIIPLPCVIKLEIVQVDYQPVNLSLPISADTTLNIDFFPIAKVALRDVKVESSRIINAIVNSSKSFPTVKIKEILSTPSVAGEDDPLKVIQYLPGIKSGIQGTMDLYVRGGGKGENLYLIDEATIYSPGHLLGIISVFNPRALKDVTILKESFSAEYGGRAASVVDLQMKEGNMQSLKGEASIGLLTGSATVEGPLFKNKSSFFISGRRSILDQADVFIKRNIPYNLFDLYAKFNLIVNDNNRVYISLYNGCDKLNSILDYGSAILGDTSKLISNMGNATATIRWNHILKSKRTFLNLSVIQSKYFFDFKYGSKLTSDFILQSNLQDKSIKFDVDHLHSAKHKLKYGGQYNYKQFSPNLSLLESTITAPVRFYAHEYAIYLQDEMQLCKQLKVNMGMRFSGSVNEQVYANVEPRLQANYTINRQHRIKASFTKMAQYNQLVSNANAANLPTDFWMPANEYLKPIQAFQYSTGYFTGLKKYNLFLSVEAYWKNTYNIAELINIPFAFDKEAISNNLKSGTSTAKGIEVFMHRPKGVFKWWASYCWSKATVQMNGINNGNKYLANFDKTHDFSLVANYDISSWLTFSSAYVYATGAPFTPQVGALIFPGTSLNELNVIPIMGARNSLRFLNTNRLDCDLVLHPSRKDRNKSELKIGVYNIFNRPQPNFIRSNLNPALPNFQQFGLIGILPHINYLYKFNLGK